ncbi:MAG: ABC transporter permease, partial [bacterium]|nr:ABC transporter permease [bacterium]
MLVYVVRRLAAALMTALVAATMAYLALLAIPGDPVQVILGMNVGGGAALGARLGIAASPVAQYVSWLAHLARGDLGNSINYGAPVTQLILQRLPVTIPIVAGAALVTFVVALPLGILAAVRRGKAMDAALIALSQAGTIIPSFWLGLLLILFFGVHLRWLPTSGFAGWLHDPRQSLASLILPMLAIGLTEAAIVTRQVRGSVLDQLAQDYVRTARSKGASPQRVLL